MKRVSVPVEFIDKQKMDLEIKTLGQEKFSQVYAMNRSTLYRIRKTLGIM